MGGSLSRSGKRLARTDHPAARWFAAAQRVPSGPQLPRWNWPLSLPTRVCFAVTLLTLVTSRLCACLGQLSCRPSVQNRTFQGMAPPGLKGHRGWGQKQGLSCEAPGSGAVRHTPSSPGRVAVPLGRRAGRGNRLSSLLVSGVSWPPFVTPCDLLMGRDNLSTVPRVLTTAGEGVLLHSCRPEGAHEGTVRS